MRPKRGAGEIVHTFVDELLERSTSGPGFRSVDGQEFRRFYFDLALTPPAVRRQPASPGQSDGRTAEPSSPTQSRPVMLTPRELTVAALYVAGFTVPEGAAQLGISTSTFNMAIRSVRGRYEAAGIDVTTKAALATELERERPAVGRYGQVERQAERLDSPNAASADPS